MIDREVVVKEYGSLIKTLTELRESWNNYSSEPFMAGKVEAADVFIQIITKAYLDVLEKNNA